MAEPILNKDLVLLFIASHVNSLLKNHEKDIKDQKILFEFKTFLQALSTLSEKYYTNFKPKAFSIASINKENIQTLILERFSDLININNDSLIVNVVPTSYERIITSIVSSSALNYSTQVIQRLSKVSLQLKNSQAGSAEHVAKKAKYDEIPSNQTDDENTPDNKDEAEAEAIEDTSEGVENPAVEVHETNLEDKESKMELDEENSSNEDNSENEEKVSSSNTNEQEVEIGSVDDMKDEPLDKSDGEKEEIPQGEEDDSEANALQNGISDVIKEEKNNLEDNVSQEELEVEDKDKDNTSKDNLEKNLNLEKNKISDADNLEDHEENGEDNDEDNDEGSEDNDEENGDNKDEEIDDVMDIDSNEETDQKTEVESADKNIEEKKEFTEDETDVNGEITEKSPPSKNSSVDIEEKQESNEIASNQDSEEPEAKEESTSKKSKPEELPVVEKVKEEETRKRTNSPAQQKRFQHIAVNLIDSVQSHRFSSPFLQAVNKKEAPDYYDVIYQPRDLKNMLKAIKQKTDTPLYSLIKELERDVMLMFSNCIMYNQSNEGLVELTRSMLQDVENIFKLFEETEQEIK